MATIGQLNRILRQTEEQKLVRAKRATYPHTQKVLKGRKQGNLITHFKNEVQRQEVIELMMSK